MENALIEASAGTGKTEALARHLIGLLKAGCEPQEIVALTFSRAAAGEIFERFVSLLAKDGETALLQKVIASQHLSQIGTLDSFLMRIVRAFPAELGLADELEMMDDYQAREERARISFSILRRTNAKLKKTFVEAFSLAMNREDVRSFTDSYRAFVGNWHELLTAFPSAEAWGEAKTIWPSGIPTITERELAHAADAVLRTFDGQAKWREFAEWVRAFRGRFGTPKGLAKKLLEKDDVFVGDTIEFSFSRKPYLLTRAETLVVRDALMCVFVYVLRQKLELARGIHKLLTAFETVYAEKVRAAGKLVFADVPRLLARLPDETRLALEYRMDARIRAWALDEFQDTSREQWSALSNLIDEAKQSAGEKSLFVVGDTKQAIYGWRNGDVNIFKTERESGFYKLDELTKTYRSGPAVVEAVNRIFARGRIFSEFPAWRCPEHESARTELGGRVAAIDAPGRKMEDFVEPVQVALAAAVRFDPRQSIAILVRGNKFGAFLADRLKMRGVKGVVWEGASPVLDTPALAGFLDLIQLADHPGDVLTYRHFRMTQLAAYLYPKMIPDAMEISREISRQLTTRGLVRTLREWRALLPTDPDIAWSRFTEERYVEMLRAAAEFEQGLTPVRRFADFAEYLAAKSKRTLAEDGKIKIMTIHRSKGLGFDHVIVPLYEPDSLTADGGGPLIGEDWILPDPTARVAKAVGGLEEAYALRKNREEQEALCTYYVALTRAKRSMNLILHPAGTSLKFSDLVRSANLEDLKDGEMVRSAARDETEKACPLPTPERQPRRTVRRRLPSLQQASGVSAGSLFATDDRRRAALARGTTAHRAMEAVEFSDELPRPQGFVELWREKAFEVFADGEWISGRIDRVTFFETPDGLSAEVVDFKTSLEHPERYEAQLATYRRAVSIMTGIPASRISTRLVLIS